LPLDPMLFYQSQDLDRQNVNASAQIMAQQQIEQAYQEQFNQLHPRHMARLLDHGREYFNIPRLAPFVTTRTISIGKNDDEIFWKIPAVAYLVERIPAAKVVIKPTAFTLTYLTEAKAQGLSLRAQCDDLGIPWSARLLTADEASVAAVKIASILPPSVFSQAKEKSKIGLWAENVLWLAERGAHKSVVEWAAWHMADLQSDDRDYLLSLSEIAPSTKASTIRERSLRWHRDQDLRQAVLQYGFKLSARAKIPHDLERCSHSGFDFVAFRTLEDFIEDGRDQKHCIATRFRYAAMGTHVYFSIRSGSSKIATVEYAPTGELLEIKGPTNRMPEARVVHAATGFGAIVRNGPPSTDVTAAETDTKRKEEPQPTKSVLNRLANVLAPPVRLSIDAKSWTG